ncbi:phospholipase B1, membrane-associated-like [Rhinatrema bivittatum]|uniref:phospholipase B1, membrane-associated-like n=1 Tax=Rhinatrema bivittatum TaxID=194408 RepID=UPI00112D03F6|nr:phospholipase B1, membrane-associated-like [Rhinatrema bivittatum]XP_029453574.1 phospholipase B1, membrane-associated-like [Rhinatrema bivittatum]
MEPIVVLQSFTCVLLLEHAHGSDNWNAYISGIKEQISLLGVQEFPEKAGKQSGEHEPLVCPDMKPSPSVPDKANKVKPADVKIIAALGDSVTAAAGANATKLEEMYIEYRQLSWSIGGYGSFSDIITLPNIFKLFNPNIIGYSTGETKIEKGVHWEKAGFNLAVSGAKSHELTEQARQLITILKGNPEISFQNDWKVVTIFIGANDLCNYCRNKLMYSAEIIVSNMKTTLDILYKELPRAIINVVQIFWMEGVRDLSKGSASCVLLKLLCPCVVEPEDNSLDFQELLEQNALFQKKLEDLIHSNPFNKRKDFAVVLQPFLKKSRPSKDSTGNMDYSYFTLDCFHFSIKGHEELAKGLWNNMFQSEGEKAEVKTFSEPLKLICPSKDHPYIYIEKHNLDWNLASPMLHGSYLIILLILILELEFL